MLQVSPWDEDKCVALVVAYQQLSKIVTCLHNQVITGEMAAAELERISKS